MKKLITILVLLIGLTVSGQTSDKTLADKAKETVEEYVDVDTSLNKIDDVKGLFVHYFKEATEGTKDLIGSGIEVAEKAVTMMVEQSTVIVR